ncbi:MAG: acyl-CoA dehydrogenase family protein, partial [Acidimicrobiia bacterium]
SDDPLHLIVEIKGYRGEDAKEKKSTTDTYWVPGVNHLGTYGRWAFAEFTEVYMTDVRIPDSSRLGAVGEGWRVVITTLMNERVSIGANVPPRNWGAIGEAVRLWEANPATRSTRDDLLRLWTEAEAARLTNIRAQQLRYKGTPGPEGSLAKLVYAELNKKAWDFCVDLLGPEGMLYGSYEMTIPEAVTLSPAAHDLRRNFLRSRANSIEGGTSEIMKNIIGERVLGLPGEPRVDKDLPWSEVPRS